MIDPQGEQVRMHYRTVVTFSRGPESEPVHANIDELRNITASRGDLVKFAQNCLDCIIKESVVALCETQKQNLCGLHCLMTIFNTPQHWDKLVEACFQEAERNTEVLDRVIFNDKKEIQADETGNFSIEVLVGVILKMRKQNGSLVYDPAARPEESLVEVERVDAREVSKVEIGDLTFAFLFCNGSHYTCLSKLAAWKPWFYKDSLQGCFAMEPQARTVGKRAYKTDESG